MSTSSIVEFKANGERVQVYVHHDGYPDYMIPLLKEFLKWNHARNDDASYTAANFIYWYKRMALKRAREMMRETFKAKGYLLQIEQTGVGILPLMSLKKMYSSYIEYFYKVYLTEIVSDPPDCEAGYESIIHSHNLNQSCNATDYDRVVVHT